MYKNRRMNFGTHNYKFNNKKKKIMNSQEIYEEMVALFTQFEENHNTDTKAAKARARKAIGELKKLVTEYRKASVAESK